MRFPDFNDEWKETTLGEIAERVTRKNNGHVTSRPLTISAQYGLIDQRDFFNKIVASTSLEGYYLLNKGEFAYNRSSSADYPWGAIKRLENYENGALSTLYICFSLLQGYPSFIAHFFETSQWHEYIQSIAAEGARNHGLLNISVSDFFALPISLPTLAEQKKIADFLSLIDERIQSCSETIKELKTQKAGLLNQLLSQKLRFPDFDDEWTQTTLGEISRNISSGKDKLSEKGNYHLYGSRGLLGHTETKSYTSNIILVARVGANAGEVIWVSEPCGVTDNALIIEQDNDSYLKANSRFIFMRLLSAELNKLSFGSGQPLITASMLKAYTLALPSLEEQKKIADFLSLIDERIEVEEQLLQQYEKQKRYLLKQMFV